VLYKTPYAAIVKSGESALMVCTNDTGIKEIAIELNKWPETRNRVNGLMVMKISHEGESIPFSSDLVTEDDLIFWSEAKIQVTTPTNANWIQVRRMGTLTMPRSCFPILLVIEEERYQQKNIATISIVDFDFGGESFVFEDGGSKGVDGSGIEVDSGSYL
jgi:hypothetical protein